MTNEEAIKTLKNLHNFYKSMISIFDEVGPLPEESEAIEMAIQALEQQSCEDAISRQAATDAMYELCNTGETLGENKWRDNPYIDKIVDTLENLPPFGESWKEGD